MNTDNIAPETSKVQWVIDMDWYEQHNRTFMDLAKRGLCPKCVEKLGKKKKPAKQADIIAAIKDCCSGSPEFITSKMPIMESAFRIILANGNQPLDVEELSRQLFEKRGNTFSTSAVILNRLLSNDRWYGFRKISEEPAPAN